MFRQRMVLRTMPHTEVLKCFNDRPGKHIYKIPKGVI